MEDLTNVTGADQDNINTDTTTQTQTDGNSTDENQDKSTEQPFKVFANEEEYNKAIKSEKSKAKNEVLKELGIKSIDEAKASLTKAQTLEQELNTTKQSLNSTQEQLALIEIGVKEEYRQEALTLAKTAGGDLKEALKAVVTKLPIMKGTATNVNIGGQKTDPKDTENSATPKLASKYSWIK